MAVNTNPMNKSPERAFALQKYLLLHSQHDALQKHLTAISASASVPTAESMSGPRARDMSSSPPTSNNGFRSFSSTPISPISETSDDFTLTLPARPTMGRPRRSSLPATMATFESSHESEIEEEELKLLNVNQQIKSTLTELMNCESVREDRQYRIWCQERLMDVEKEMRGTRKGSCEKRRGSLDVASGANGF